MNVTPLRDRIIVKPLDPETQTKGGIVIPENAKDDLKAMKAEVIASGEGRITDDGTLVPNAVKAGKTILYGQFTGSKMTIENEEYIILKEDEVLAIID